MPPKTIIVQAGPEEADAKGTGGEDHREETTAHGGTGGILVAEGTESDAGVAHAGRCFGQGEEEQMVEKRENAEDH
ncbi:MAG TPA: hypothetical protein VI386_22775, partial [Candidatus Sulfotelmatobacter sp.]